MIANVARINTYNGDGSNDTFAYTFRIVDEDFLVVLVSDGTSWTVQTISVDYSVTNVNDLAGGNVVFAAGSIPPAGTNNVVILGFTNRTQLVQLVEGGVGYINLEEELDKLTMMVQELTRQLAIPGPTGGKLLIGWNEYGETHETKDGTEILLTGLPTSDPGVPGQLWNDSGTVKVSL